MMPITEMRDELARMETLAQRRAGERAAGFAGRMLPLLLCLLMIYVAAMLTDVCL